MRNIVCITSMLGLLIACDRASTNATDGGTSSDKAAVNLTRVGSCDRAQATGTCSEYNGGYLAQNELLVKSSCAKLNGTFVYAECPNTSVVGACTLSSGEIRKFYATGVSGYEPARARTECESSFRGTWQAR